MKKDREYIRGWSATSTSLKQDKNFEESIAGIPLYLMALQVFIINFISFCLGAFYNITIGAIITSLLNLSIRYIEGILFALILLFLLYFPLVFIVTLLYTLNNIYVFNIQYLLI